MALSILVTTLLVFVGAGYAHAQNYRPALTGIAAPGNAYPDTRAYSVSGIHTCVDTHVGDATGTISSSKGAALLNCITSTRVNQVNTAAIDALMKKIEALKAKIDALKASAQ